MAFMGILIMAALLGMFIFGVCAAIGTLVLTLVYRRKHRRWMRITAILLGIAAVVSIAVPVIFCFWVTSF